MIHTDCNREGDCRMRGHDVPGAGGTHTAAMYGDTRLKVSWDDTITKPGIRLQHDIQDDRTARQVNDAASHGAAAAMRSKERPCNRSYWTSSWTADSCLINIHAMYQRNGNGLGSMHPLNRMLRAQASHNDAGPPRRLAGETYITTSMFPSTFPLP